MGFSSGTPLTRPPASLLAFPVTHFSSGTPLTHPPTRQLACFPATHPPATHPPTRLSAGPSNHFWQGLLVSLFPPAASAAGSSTRRCLDAALRLLQRVGLDQLLYAPVNNCLMFLYVSVVADQRSWATARAKLVAELPAVQRRGWRVWPAVQLINQSLVPLEVRLAV